MQLSSGQIAVVTGGGAGIGRELVRQLVAKGCHAAFCDLIQSNIEETLTLCAADNPHNATVTGHICDVASEAQARRFLQDVQTEHRTDHINLLINNAGINGGGSFVQGSREEWERVFDINWSGVYLMTRTFLPLLLRSAEGHLVNMSSANAIRAVLGGHVPHTAYSTAKFAVRGFSESLIHDFRYNAPHLGVSVVLPGHTGTEIIGNSLEILGHSQPASWSSTEIKNARKRWELAGIDGVQDMSDEAVRANGAKEIQNMRELGLPPSSAARIILQGVESETWRILIGTDTIALDALVRESPDSAYDDDFVQRWREASVAVAEED